MLGGARERLIALVPVAVCVVEVGHTLHTTLTRDALTQFCRVAGVGDFRWVFVTLSDRVCTRWTDIVSVLTIRCDACDVT